MKALFCHYKNTGFFLQFAENSEAENGLMVIHLLRKLILKISRNNYSQVKNGVRGSNRPPALSKVKTYLYTLANNTFFRKFTT